MMPPEQKVHFISGLPRSGSTLLAGILRQPPFPRRHHQPGGSTAQAIPASAVYRKFRDGAWHNFVSDANNSVHSAPGNPGYCPPPGDSEWEPGLKQGYYCVQLTIEDGGPNDADGLVYAAVEDPGSVGVSLSSSSRIHSKSKGGWWFQEKRVCISGMAKSVSAARMCIRIWAAALT